VGQRTSILTILRPTVAVGIGLLAGAFAMLSRGTNPATAYQAMFDGALSGFTELGSTLDRAMPLLCAGLAVALAFRAGLLNLGVPGQWSIGALFSAWVGFQFDLPALVHLPLALIVGAALAALWGGLAGALEAVRGVPVAISTILFNFVAIGFTSWLATRRPWSGSGGSAPLPVVADSAQMPRIGSFSIGFLVAVLAAVGLWWVLDRSTFGFEVRTVGASWRGAARAGISRVRVVIATMVVSAAIAGLGGALGVAGVHGRFQPGVDLTLALAGFTVALLARAHPIGVIPAAFVLGAIGAGSSVMVAEVGLQADVVTLIYAVIALVAAAPFVTEWFGRGVQVGEFDEIRLSRAWRASP
jgi:simple sugar transport system permease protein